MSFCPDRNIIDWCLKCKHHESERKHDSRRCCVCKDSTIGAKISLHTYDLTPLYFVYKNKKKMNEYAQLYFNFV